MLMKSVDELAASVDGSSISCSWNLTDRTINKINADIGFGVYDASRKVLRMSNNASCCYKDINILKGQTTMPLSPGKYKLELGVLYKFSLDEKEHSYFKPIKGRTVSVSAKNTALPYNFKEI